MKSNQSVPGNAPFWRKHFDGFRGDRHFVRLWRNGVALLGSSTTVTLIEFAQIVVLTRLLLPERYGVLVLVMTYVGMINQFLDVRVRETAVRFGTEFTTAGDLPRLAALLKMSYLVDVAIAFLSFAAVFVTAAWGSRIFLHAQDLAPLVQIYGLTVLAGCLKGTSNSILVIRDRFKWVSIYGVAMALCECASVTAAVLLGFGVKGVLITLIITEVLRCLVSTILASRAMAGLIPLHLVARAPLSALSGRGWEIGRLMFHSNFMGYFRMINTKVDFLILGAFRPAGEVGLYKLARSLATVIGRISDPFFGAILPDLSRLWVAGDEKAYKTLILRSSLVIGSAMAFAALFVSLFSTFIVQMTSGSAFAGAAPLLGISVWSFAIGGAFFWTWPAAVSIGRADLGTKVGLLVVTVQLLLAFFLVPQYGAMGNAIALLACYAVGQPLLAFLVFRDVTRKAQLRNSKSLSAATVSGDVQAFLPEALK